jgi:alcohol dehydrogenase (cytochrome c)
MLRDTILAILSLGLVSSVSESGAAIAGGVITYDAGGGQRVAVTAGMTSPIWPTPKIPGKVVVLGL